MSNRDPREAREAASSGEQISPARRIEFTDSANVFWRVAERDCRGDAGSRGASCLIFSSDHAVRRVWSYPTDWHSLSASALDALSRSR